MILQTETEWLTGMCEHAHEKTNIMLIVQLITQFINELIEKIQVLLMLLHQC